MITQQGSNIFAFEIQQKSTCVTTHEQAINHPEQERSVPNHLFQQIYIFHFNNSGIQLIYVLVRIKYCDWL